MKFTALDYWYPEAFAAWDKTSAPCHGTADFWDLALRAEGHQSDTLIANRYRSLHDLFGDIPRDTDVIISRNVGRWPGRALRSEFPDTKIVGFCSYRTEDANLVDFDMVFSSFGWMEQRCHTIRVPFQYLPLAFGRQAIDRIGELPKERDIPVAFVGGLGDRIWKTGTATMAHIAARVPGFIWKGYRAGDVPDTLEKVFDGECWGKEMYSTLARTKIIVNRHGEIAASSGTLFGNNCRQYEAGGMGCCLVTDDAGVYEGTAIEYSSPNDAVEIIEDILRRGTAEEAGRIIQEETLGKHTFDHRISRFLEAINRIP